MKKYFTRLSKTIIIALALVATIMAQGQEYQGPNDPAGDIAAEREGTMEGNRVYLYFRNTTELSDHPKASVSKWPNNPDGVKMVDGVGLLVGGKVYIEDDGDPFTTDTIPLTTPAEIQSATDKHELYYLQTSYREEMDVNPARTLEWGFYPVFGYFNKTNEYPAMSNKENSWPIGGWPSGNGLKWPGEWDGRFGRGVIYADMETYFVVNDAQDLEYLGIEDKVKYYPRPGNFIGDINPNVTIQKENPWGGLGLRVETRGFQWNNPQARDAIFWEYSIANISDYDVTEVTFGYWVDNAIGGDDANDELGYFDSQLDMAYSWDIDGVGLGGLKTGTMGFAYLESPGFAYDQIDNDNDGLLNEKRDNPATTLIGPHDGMIDEQAFLDFYNLTIEDLHEHWDADEDQDWEDGEDLNGDGIYQLSEFAGDDIGLDGVAPGELNYTGPDEGECNHRPDFLDGYGCEPNFNKTDVSESDMVGLTCFRMFPIPSHNASNTTLWFKNDPVMFELTSSNELEEFEGNISNLVEVFASGPFPLYQGRVERISMSELHSNDPSEGINEPDYSVPALYELKRIVQIIYEKDYRFAQPPKMPTVTATAGDNQVILTWDNIADTRTRDPFVGNINDFEGYKVYRASDKYMSDPEVITDGYGTPTFSRPIFQCDIVDDKRGFTDFGMINGMGYYLGNETGISHVFIDNNVQNGRTYYYAVVAYDFGAPDIGPGIAPSENNIVIEKNEAEVVTSWGKNVAIVTPHQPAAGYVPPEIATQENEDFFGTGEIKPSILAAGGLNPGHKYQVSFGIDIIDSLSNYSHGILYSTNSVSIYDVSDDTVLVYEENPNSFIGNNLVYRDSSDYWSLNTISGFDSDVFDGIQLVVNPDVETAEFDYTNSDWLVGGTGTVMHVHPSDEESTYLPWDYDIVFTGEDSAYVGVITNKSGVRYGNGEPINRNYLLTQQAFDFYVVNKSFTDSTGAYDLMDMIVLDVNDNDVFDKYIDQILVGAPKGTGSRWQATLMVIDFNNGNDATYPLPNDIYRVTFKRPFWKSDIFEFEITSADSINRDQLDNDMDKIMVVPNPYVMTNMMEPAVANPFLNQRRRLLFTNIPAECEIKIFTVSGVLVDDIHVANEPEKGIVHWDMLTREGLEIAAGMYIYHIKSNVTGNEKVGKFAVIK
ncbi:MAG: hypothetical protein HQ509_11045 [Candidatus Marinimicrobia bacterium]|nr:hypothetical protein [Candidatus Neomarinimicrobiota bacterium]